MMKKNLEIDSITERRLMFMYYGETFYNEEDIDPEKAKINKLKNLFILMNYIPNAKSELYNKFKTEYNPTKSYIIYESDLKKYRLIVNMFRYRMCDFIEGTVPSCKVLTADEFMAHQLDARQKQQDDNLSRTNSTDLLDLVVITYPRNTPRNSIMIQYLISLVQIRSFYKKPTLIISQVKLDGLESIPDFEHQGFDNSFKQSVTDTVDYNQISIPVSDYVEHKPLVVKVNKKKEFKKPNDFTETEKFKKPNKKQKSNLRDSINSVVEELYEP